MYWGNRVIIGLLLAGLFGFNTSAAQALPPDMNLSYHIRENPNDENSDVVFTVKLNIKAILASIPSGKIAWKIQSATFEQFFSNQTSRTWTKSLPYGTKLWGVVHADPDNPTENEFANTPILAGTATATNSADPDLTFSFDGNVYVSTTNMFNGSVSSLTAKFTEAGETEPEEECEEEPVEVEGVEDII